MTWFEQNRFLGAFLLALALATIASAFFLWSAKSRFGDAKSRFEENAIELNRLQRLTPFPTEANLRKMKTQAEEYAATLNKTKEDLKARVLPVVPMAPNEFQSRLRQAANALADKARSNRVQLPDNFNLGFDEFAAALPDTAAAPLLGQQLAQVELLVNIMIDARVEALTSLRRVSAEQTPKPAVGATPIAGRKPPAPAAGPQLVERTVVEAAFTSSPGAARKVLNQISTAEQQFYIVRTLHLRNEKDKGPPREAGAAGGVAPARPGTAGGTPATTPNTALQFIVGTERVQTSARIEMLRFTY
jgi:hypothetical protein